MVDGHVQGGQLGVGADSCVLPQSGTMAGQYANRLVGIVLLQGVFNHTENRGIIRLTGNGPHGQQATMVLQRQYSNLIMRGLSREQVEEQIEQLQAGSEQQAEQQLKTFFIMDEVAEKLDISVSEEEINGHIAQLAVQRHQRPEQMREQMARDGSLAQFGLEIRQNKCISKLLETAEVTEKKAKKEKKSKRKAEKSPKKTAKKTTKKSAKAEGQ